MDGLHLTADLTGCAAGLPAMTDAQRLRELCLQSVHAAGLSPVADLFHRFRTPPAALGAAPASTGDATGITGVVLLAESHLAVHTWPELGAVTLDVYVCNLGGDNSERARRLLDSLCAAFAPREACRQQLRRGRPPARALAG